MMTLDRCDVIFVLSHLPKVSIHLPVRRSLVWPKKSPSPLPHRPHASSLIASIEKERFDSYFYARPINMNTNKYTSNLKFYRMSHSTCWRRSVQSVQVALVNDNKLTNDIHFERLNTKTCQRRSFTVECLFPACLQHVSLISANNIPASPEMAPVIAQWQQYVAPCRPGGRHFSSARPEKKPRYSILTGRCLCSSELNFTISILISGFQ